MLNSRFYANLASAVIFSTCVSAVASSENSELFTEENCPGYHSLDLENLNDSWNKRVKAALDHDISESLDKFVKRINKRCDAEVYEQVREQAQDLKTKFTKAHLEYAIQRTYFEDEIFRFKDPSSGFDAVRKYAERHSLQDYLSKRAKELQETEFTVYENRDGLHLAKIRNALPSIKRAYEDYLKISERRDQLEWYDVEPYDPVKIDAVGEAHDRLLDEIDEIKDIEVADLGLFFIFDFDDIEEKLKELDQLVADVGEVEKLSLGELIARGQKAMTDRKESCTNIELREEIVCDDSEKTEFIHAVTGKPFQACGVRDQNNVGWCYAVAAAELVSAEEGRCYSTAAFAIAYNEAGVLSSARKKLYDYDDTKKEVVEEGGFISFSLESAQKHPVCLECDLPLRDFKIATVPEKYRSYLGLLRWIRESATEAMDAPAFVEKHYTDIKQFFPKLEKPEIIEILDESRDGSAVHALFMATLESGEKISSDYKVSRFLNMFSASHKDRSEMIELMDRWLQLGKVVGLSYNAYYLKYDFPSKHLGQGGHASTVVARRFNDESGSCEYLVRNSWGDSCDGYNSSLDCEKGNIWLPEHRMFQAIKGVTRVSRPSAN